MPLAPNHDLDRLRHLDPSVFRNPGVEYVGRPDAEGDAPDGADMRRVRIRSHVHLPGQRIGLQHHGVADALRALTVGQFAMQFDSLLLREVFLLQLELRRQIEQPHLFLFLRDHFIEEGEMVAEEADAGSVVHRNILADILLIENGSHGRDVLMTEAQIDGSEPRISRLNKPCGDGALPRSSQGTRR